MPEHFGHGNCDTEPNIEHKAMLHVRACALHSGRVRTLELLVRELLLHVTG